MAAATPRRSRLPGAVLVVAAVVAGVIALLVALPLLIPALNPFHEDTIDRSQPVLRKSLENLSDYHAATANMQQVVDVEHDTNLLPSFIKGDRTLFVASGSVDAAVDFRRLRKGAIDVSDDRRAVTITLPPAHLTPARLDTTRSRVYDRDRGVLDRIGDAVSDDGGADQQALYALAESKLQAAAAADPALRATAERNTKAMLEGLLRGLGFERITIRFERAPV
jgi:hypothetical protein